MESRASGHDNGTMSDVKAHHQAVGKGHVPQGKKLSRSSSSSSSSSQLSEDIFKLDASGTSKSTADGSMPHRYDQESEDDFPLSSMPRQDEAINGSATQNPPTQVMERPEGSPRRIPSCVFARTNTAAPMEWSVASNESLFSIQMGNMSFTRDQMNWMYKSGELGMPGDSPFSSPLMDLSLSPPATPPPQTNKSPELAMKSSNLDGGFGVTEAAAAETMREVIRENEEDRNEGRTPHVKDSSARSGSISQHSDASVKSFAFPILAGDADSLRTGTKNHKQQSQPPTPKAIPGRQSEPHTPKAVPAAQSESPMSKSQTPKAQNAAQGKWFSCFPCCPFCY